MFERPSIYLVASTILNLDQLLFFIVKKSKCDLGSIHFSINHTKCHSIIINTISSFITGRLRGSEFSNILVPYDGKEMSDLALEESAKFAKPLGSRITLLYVIDEKYARPSAITLFIGEKKALTEAKNELRRILASGAEHMLRERSERLSKSGIPVDFKVAFGTPSEEILKQADSKKFGIIIMGSRSLKRFKKFRALGSVARRVSELSRTPVMLVH